MRWKRGLTFRNRKYQDKKARDAAMGREAEMYRANGEEERGVADDGWEGVGEGDVKEKEKAEGVDVKVLEKGVGGLVI